MDVHEDEKQNIVTGIFELPGVKKEDINLDVTNNLLTVSGESKQSTERDEAGYVVRERRAGKFSRSISVPQGVKVCTMHGFRCFGDNAYDVYLQTEDIKASFDNGVLTVTFPKRTPEQAPKRITIS